MVDVEKAFLEINKCGEALLKHDNFIIKDLPYINGVWTPYHWMRFRVCIV